MVVESRGEIKKNPSGSSFIFSLYNHTTFSQTQTGAIVPLNIICPMGNVGKPGIGRFLFLNFIYPKFDALSSGRPKYNKDIHEVKNSRIGLTVQMLFNSAKASELVSVHYFLLNFNTFFPIL
jgi:hypothetical protein